MEKVPKGDERKRFGNWGEEEASRFLEGKGFEILKRNFRTGFGEIDIVARDGETLVFVEVRTKSDSMFGDPLETISPKKKSRLERLAAAYLVINKVPGQVPCRFDVIGIIARDGVVYEMEHIVDAFGW